MILTISDRLRIAALAVVLGLMGAASGFVYGRNSNNTASAKDDASAVGFHQGRAVGLKQGRATTLAGFAPGKVAYNRIYRKGYAAGSRAGYKKGSTAGARAGATQGETTGENNVFQGFAGGWQLGGWYVVKLASGGSIGHTGQYGLSARIGPIRRSQTYQLCDSGNGICRSG
jgi:hypothetical protein